jgi:hypothetical protein
MAKDLSLIPTHYSSVSKPVGLRQLLILCEVHVG